ncbi:hypothetical protein WJ96_04340 [Burkholderia ubonensis]|uniref:Uncharacterized protein n=1 Tax=Burkholderia ubonensis TaxID=101571 RepID=A0AAW3MQG2_9BURK|nr:hypothetical protein [Burkholderia ubonensis]KVP65601.1 hypothetical protein WJ93_24075 [Burkholderia ubonensis]KVP96458.1 hypothetical protein WJ97_11250 [Burkholderia ubonensis]KVP97804.1 hypothetical protein WJ96_04340 [Burkholderia ubonensis]KVZ92501.1 hypothetical protein WL25_15995 [Burkholderia ubonensis]
MLTTEVFAKGAARFDMTGKSLPTLLHITDEQISLGLATRLYRYAERELINQGFGSLAKDAKVKVYTIDAEDRPADRSYCVRWHTPQGGYVELVGILTKSGWPSLDHGFAIGYEEHDA